MSRIILESPYKAKTFIGRWINKRYARKCMRHSLALGEAPFASHLLYTQVLNDQNAHERKWGIEAGFAWTTAAGKIAVYIDRGISDGMKLGIRRAKACGVTIEYRTIESPPAWAPREAEL